MMRVNREQVVKVPQHSNTVPCWGGPVASGRQEENRQKRQNARQEGQKHWYCVDRYRCPCFGATCASNMRNVIPALVCLCVSAIIASSAERYDVGYAHS